MIIIVGSKICDIDGCKYESAEIITAESGAENSNSFFQVSMRSFHYRNYRSDESIGKLFYIKDVPVQERHN
jgi:hypothetical protein